MVAAFALLLMPAVDWAAKTQVAEQDHALAEATQRLRREIAKRIEAEEILRHIVRQN